VRILDLYCGAGGAGKGYADAGFEGFEVVGVDINPQPNYPYEFHQADAITYLLTHYREFDAVHASPPCQRYSGSASFNNSAGNHPDLLGPTRLACIMTGLPYIIENVPGAPLDDPFMLCGTMFNMGAHDVDGVWLQLKRHRLFETNWDYAHMRQVQCNHVKGVVSCSVFGYGGAMSPEYRDSERRHKGYVPALPVLQEAMGVDWTTKRELSESIPPKFTQWIGAHLAEYLRETPE
jgi:DNA (cytosine-5)-methyltransferase 1